MCIPSGAPKWIEETFGHRRPRRGGPRHRLRVGPHRAVSPAQSPSVITLESRLWTSPRGTVWSHAAFHPRRDDQALRRP